MFKQNSDFRLLQGLCFRLLPIQVLLALVGTINGIVSSLFASNFLGAEAMSAIGLYGPLNSSFVATSTMLMGGSQIICGKYMGKNQLSGMQNAFSVSMLLSLLLSVGGSLLLLAIVVLDISRVFTTDPAVNPLFEQYLLGMALGIVPQVVGQLLSGFLSLENKNRLTTVAGISYVFSNLVLDYLFIVVLQLGIFGLALASAIGLWIFAGIQLSFYVRGKSMLHLSFRHLCWGECADILKVGSPGALSYRYQILRGFIVNALILRFVGSVGISAFAASNSFLGLFWTLPSGMLAVSRMLISVSVGEEDRQSLQDVMRIMFRRYLPLMFAVAALLFVFSVPLTRMYYSNVNDPVFMMTVWGFRILPLSMPLSTIYMHFMCYAQVSGKKLLMHLLPLVDGVLGAAIPTAILIPFMGMNSVYWANVINGIATTLIIIGYAWIQNRRFPRNMAQLMVIPDSFGVPLEDRLDITVRSMEEVMQVSNQVQHFCLEKGVDQRRSFLAALMVEEMAGNIVSHGFGKDNKRHSVDLRVSYKNQELVLRIKDDCIPFDLRERGRIMAPEDITKNIGIRMVLSLASDVSYQNIMGLNALSIRI